jgi:hypothetical protein
MPPFVVQHSKFATQLGYMFHSSNVWKSRRVSTPMYVIMASYLIKQGQFYLHLGTANKVPIF